MALDLLIIADDLTGAADTAVQFSKQGFPAVVYLPEEPCFDDAPEIAAVTTESRHCSKGSAYERVKSVTEKALRAGCRRFYKKIDSAFRGNVGAELDALMAAAGVQRLALVPAYPSAGRTTRGGVQYVNGVPLHRTSFARDPREPAAESFVPAILEKQTARAVRLAARAGGENRDGIAVYDAETDEDLRAIAADLFKGNNGDVVAGTAGFAEVMAGLFAQREGRTAFSEKAQIKTGPLFVVNGSLNDVSLGQVERARQDGVACFSPSTGSLPELIVSQLKKNGCAVLTTSVPGRDAMSSSIHSEKLGRIAAVVIKSAPKAAIAVFGGDTASAVCRGICCGALYPRREIMPGLTLSSAGSPSGPVMILKSGGFGSLEVINKIREYLKSS